MVYRTTKTREKPTTQHRGLDMAKNIEFDDKELKPIAGVPRLPEAKAEALEQTITDDKIYDNLHEFEMAVANAPLDGIEYLEVNQKVFDYLTRKQKTRYVMYKGVAVYLEGTKDRNDAIDSLSADAYGEQVGTGQIKL